MRAYTRRHMLFSGAAAALCGPFIKTFRGEAQVLSDADRNLILWFNPGGTLAPEWFPTTGALGSNLPRLLKPFETLKNDIVVVRNLNLDSWALDASFNAHGATSQLWTGQAGTGNEIIFRAGPGGVSIDQHIAVKQSAGKPFRSLNLGVHTDDTGPSLSVTSSRGVTANDWIRPQSNPWRAFQDLFSGTAVDANGALSREQAERLLLEKKSHLDFLKAEISTITTELPASDRAQFEAHLQNFRELELKLDRARTAMGTPQQCLVPKLPSVLDHRLTENVPLLGDLQIELVVAALRCKLTNVVTLNWFDSIAGSFGPPDIRFTWIGNTYAHHDLQHDHFGGEKREQHLRQLEWMNQQFAKLLTKLKGTPTGTTNLLAQSLVVQTTHFGNSAAHDFKNLPWLLAGQAGGSFKTGRYVDLGGRSVNDMLVTFTHLMGQPVNTFGAAQFCKGPIESLLV